MSYKTLGEIVLDIKTLQITGKAPSGLNEITNADGGYTVGTDVSNLIVNSILQQSTIFNSAKKFYSSKQRDDSFTVPFMSETERKFNPSAGIESYWVGEGIAKTPSIAQFDILRGRYHKLTTLIYASDEVYSDARMFSDWVDTFVPVDQAWRIEREMLLGDGADTMYGIMSADTNGTIGVAVADALDEATLKNFVKALSPSAKMAEWYMTKENYNDVLDITFTNKESLKYEDGEMYLFGFKVNVMEQMVDPYNLLLGDWSNYAVFLKQNIQKSVSFHLKFNTGEKAIQFVTRINGKSFGQKVTLEDGTVTAPFVVPATVPAEESSSSSSESNGNETSMSSESIGNNSSSSSSESSLSESSGSSSSTSSESYDDNL